MDPLTEALIKIAQLECGERQNRELIRDLMRRLEHLEALAMEKQDIQVNVTQEQHNRQERS